jgi:hypothetical protein
VKTVTGGNTPTDPVFIWYQMNMSVEGGFITGLSLDLGFIDATAD